jgi:hypothetical protein
VKVKVLWRDIVGSVTAAVRRIKSAWSSLGDSLGDILGDSLGDILGYTLGDILDKYDTIMRE